MINKTQFREWQKKHPNFMTPHIRSLTTVETVMHGDFIIELSKGTDFEHRSIYGVTVFKPKENNNGFTNTLTEPTLKDIAEMFRDIDKAKQHVEKIKQIIRELPN